MSQNVRDVEEHYTVVWLNLQKGRTTIGDVEALCQRARERGAGTNHFLDYLPSGEGPSERLVVRVVKAGTGVS